MYRKSPVLRCLLLCTSEVGRNISTPPSVSLTKLSISLVGETIKMVRKELSGGHTHTISAQVYSDVLIEVSIILGLIGRSL